ncbi:hydrogenase assembly chaperone HypC [Thermoanaerobacter kivui]|uniref:Hydrogenase assembly chaperone HypC n=1 Tax=Thermoanaerobacter kivui TaxID=2325 RepID=A0A097ANG4_THEKI|nr:HypC/HybG/HupF family hydrogenase formation chaperone [Thermoanaerobacter kivui]AIS51337.1 hydrogenase assembly chaperone HypC [Thermoanaerobacter kivui]
MCIAVPMKILSIENNKAVVELGGITRKARIDLIPDLKVGDYVIVYAGFAIEKVDEKMAKEVQEIFDEIQEYE